MIALSPLLIQKLIDREDPVILDIGANIGQHSRWFSLMYPKGRIFSFEPDPRAIDLFKKHVHGKELYSNIQIYQFAIASADGELLFYQSSENPSFNHLNIDFLSSGSIRKPKDVVAKHPQISFESSIRVKCLSLDNWFASSGLEIIDFMWVDIQGAEKDLIEGGKRAISRTRFLYTEYDDAELYEGQYTLEEILRSLPEFMLLCDYGGDVLLVNKQMCDIDKVSSLFRDWRFHNHFLPSTSSSVIASSSHRHPSHRLWNLVHKGEFICCTSEEDPYPCVVIHLPNMLQGKSVYLWNRHGVQEVRERIAGTQFFISGNLDTWEKVNLSLTPAQICGEDPICLGPHPNFPLRFIKLVGSAGSFLHLRQITIEA